MRGVGVIPAEQRIDVPVDMLTGDEMGVITRIYDQFELEMDQKAGPSSAGTEPLIDEGMMGTSSTTFAVTSG